LQVPQWIGEIVIHGPKGKIADMIMLMDKAKDVATAAVNVKPKESAVAPNRRISENLIRRASIMQLPLEEDPEQKPSQA
jgi:hypothetical protein